MRAAIYTRFSSDKQSDRSTADQARICTSFAEGKGWAVVATHQDEAVSGSVPVDSRPGSRALMADALASRFDVLLLEGLDRLSRDAVDQERIVRRLEHRGIRLVGISDGYDSEAHGRKLHRAMRGIINEVYLDDLRAKTHRGLAGKAATGHSTGGKSFGYTLAPDAGGKRLVVDPEQAKVVAQIFDWYGAQLWSVERIAYRLNELRVPSPRGTQWAKSALYGCPKKGSGILNNPLYDGRIVWNRAQWIKDPDTGKRTRFERPASEVVTTDRPDLRIVSPESWALVRRRMDATRAGTMQQHKSPTLFGGLIRCPHCKGPVNAVDVRRYGCRKAKESGPSVCPGIFVRRDVFDDRMLSIVRQELLSPEAMVAFQDLHKEISAAASKEATEGRRQGVARRQALEKEIGNLVQALATIGVSPAITAQLAKAEAELQALESAKPPTPEQQALSALEIRKIVAGLDQALKADVAQAKDLLREMLGVVELVQDGAHVHAEFVEPRAQLLSAINGASLVMVAGAGFTPQRRRIRIS
jgi:site-specific DNA recombinase